MTPEMRSFMAFFAFIFAGYLGLIGLGRAGDWDGEREARWTLRGAGVFALAGVGFLCWAAQW